MFPEARKMSVDPFLFNDQLQNSTNAPVGWNDVPVMLQEEMFEHFGCLRKVRNRRYGNRKFVKLLEMTSQLPEILALSE